MKNTFHIAAGLIVAAATLSSATAQIPAPAPIQLPARWSYAAKFVCGLSTAVTTASTAPKEPPVKRGNYATVVNIHNPNAIDTQILKKVALAAPETYPTTQYKPPTKRFPDHLPSDHTMSVDCTEIVNLLVLNGTPPTGPFIEGFLVVDAITPVGAANLMPQLDVVAVTTTATDAGAAVNSHQITPVDGRQLPAGLWAF